MTDGPTFEDIVDAFPQATWGDLEETQLEMAAMNLALAELALDKEYLLRVAAGVPTFQAQKMAEVDYLEAVRKAQARYEIALARLKRRI